MKISRDWQKSSRSNVEFCVEVRLIDDQIEVRNSNTPQPTVRFTSEEWAAFIAGVKNDEFEI